MTNFEYEYDDHTMFFGEIREIDDSFDHEFGLEKRVSYEVENLRIVVWIGGIDHDVTDSIKNNMPKMYSLYESTFREKYMDSLS